MVRSDDSSVFVLDEAVSIKASNAKASALKAGTTWKQVGTIEQGVVYRTKDQVVIVNSFDVHEAYIVVRDARVVGYYLPVERAYIAVEPVLARLRQIGGQS